MLVLVQVSLIQHTLMRLHVSQCVHCVETDNMQKNAFLARNNAILARLTPFSMKNAFKRKEKFVLAVVCLILHNLMRLHVSQCFHCEKTDDVHKKAI